MLVFCVGHGRGSFDHKNPSLEPIEDLRENKIKALITRTFQKEMGYSAHGECGRRQSLAQPLYSKCGICNHAGADLRAGAGEGYSWGDRGRAGTAQVLRLEICVCLTSAYRPWALVSGDSPLCTPKPQILPPP